MKAGSCVRGTAARQMPRTPAHSTTAAQSASRSARVSAVTVTVARASNVAAPSSVSRFLSASRAEAEASISFARHGAMARRCASASTRSPRTRYVCSLDQKNDVGCGVASRAMRTRRGRPLPSRRRSSGCQKPHQTTAGQSATA
jgi:hypothetical protein